jgi:Domain of unknown function (DUF4349)/Putative zinc-finger
MGRTAKHEFEAEEVMAYLDGELAPARAVELAGHLEHCEECAVFAKQFRQLSERLLDLGVEQTPERVGPIVLARLESGESQHGAKPSRELDEWIGAKLRRASRQPLLWGLAAATIVAFALVTAYHGSNRGGIASSTRSLSSYSVYSYQPTDRVSPKTSTAPAYIAKLAPSAKSKQLPSDSEGDGTDGGTAGKLESPAPAGPMVAQSVSLTIVANNYTDASEAIDRLASEHGGYVQTLSSEARSGAARQLSATLRLPAAQLADSLAELRKLGHVEQETRANEEVTDQYVDLQARLRSARATEQRLLQLLATRTGKLEDVLAAEQELARIREEIESMDGQRNVLLHRVSYVSVDVRLYEQYVEQLHTGSTSTTTGLHNSLVEGMHNLEDGVISLLAFLFAYGPSIIFWCGLILIPGYFVWRRVRARNHE